jgi:hypothetical protein
MRQDHEQNHVTPTVDTQKSFDHSREKNTHKNWAGEPLEGSGFEKEIPDPDFEWQE